jgi:hypothetical protein
MACGSDTGLAASSSSRPATLWESSAQAGLVEHRNHGRASALLFSEPCDVPVERLKVVRCRRGVSSALKDPYGGGVGTAVGLLQDLVGHSLIDGGRVGRAGGLAAFGDSQPQVASELVVLGGLRRVPGELRVAVAQQRVDERARVALAQGGARGVTLDRRSLLPNSSVSSRLAATTCSLAATCTPSTTTSTSSWIGSTKYSTAI